MHLKRESEKCPNVGLCQQAQMIVALEMYAKMASDQVTSRGSMKTGHVNLQHKGDSDTKNV